jgi:hypothetical protein
MADEGLFSGLKFTDVLFPALAAGASAYNPYIGYGLQTGMNVFNTMGQFQNDLKKWKMIREEQERMDAAADEYKAAASQNIEGLRSQIEQRRRYADQDLRMDLTNEILQGGGIGAPSFMPQEDLSSLPLQMQQQAALQASGPQSDIDLQGAFPDRMPKFSDIISAQADPMLERQMFEDPAQQALRKELAEKKLASAGIDLSPGSAVQTMGILGEQAHGTDQEMRRMQEVLRQDGMRQERDLIAGEISRRGQMDVIERQAEVNLAAKKEGYAAWQAVSTQIDAAMKDKGMSLEDLHDVAQDAEQALADLMMVTGENSPDVRKARIRLNGLYQRIELRQGQSPEGKEGDGMTPGERLRLKLSGRG